MKTEQLTTPETPKTLFINEDFPTPDCKNEDQTSGGLVVMHDERYLANDQDTKPENLDEQTRATRSVETCLEQDATISRIVGGSCGLVSVKRPSRNRGAHQRNTESNFDFALGLAVYCEILRVDKSRGK